MYKQLEIQQYLLLYYYTSSQFCKNYSTSLLYTKRNFIPFHMILLREKKLYFPQ